MTKYFIYILTIFELILVYFLVTSGIETWVEWVLFIELWALNFVIPLFMLFTVLLVKYTYKAIQDPFHPYYIESPLELKEQKDRLFKLINTISESYSRKESWLDIANYLLFVCVVIGLIIAGWSVTAVMIGISLWVSEWHKLDVVKFYKRIKE